MFSVQTGETRRANRSADYGSTEGERTIRIEQARTANGSERSVELLYLTISRHTSPCGRLFVSLHGYQSLKSPACSCVSITLPAVEAALRAFDTQYLAALRPPGECHGHQSENCLNGFAK